MPYFNNNDTLNILMIHIPKTGGTSLETYFSNKFNIPLNSYSLFGFYDLSGDLPDPLKTMLSAISMQHMVLRTIRMYHRYLNVNLSNNLKIITIVRNPYHRIISDLFFWDLIRKDSNQEEVYDTIIEFLQNPQLYDNHTLPQWQFLIDETNRIPRNIKILHTENLTEEMHRLGYNDFDLFSNKNKNNVEKNYLEYLNSKSISLINSLFKRDFELFGYKMHHVQSFPKNLMKTVIFERHLR
jgi:hypothetical protein